MQVRAQFPPAWERNVVGQKDGDIKADVRFRDLAKIVEVDDAIYCLFAIEHQSVEDYTMPLRIMEYDVREYLRQVKSNKGVQVQIKPIITIVMYWKADKWNQPLSVKDMFDKNTVRWLEENGLGGYIQDYRMHLFEPCAEDNLDKFKTELKDVIAYVKYSKSTEELRKYNEKNRPGLSKDTVSLINVLTNSKYEFIEGKERLDMCEAFDGIKAEGIAEGKAEGIAEGKAEELKEKYKSWVTLSNNLKKRGMSNPEIAALLGVPETELQKAFKMIKEENENIK